MIRKWLLKSIQRIYQEDKQRTDALLDQCDYTPEQINDLATKLDIIGAGAVGQAFAWSDQTAGSMLILSCCGLCVILWYYTFIMKGYTK